jgi:CubicO group peptidase (beta-lactamase class C family)
MSVNIARCLLSLLLVAVLANCTAPLSSPTPITSPPPVTEVRVPTATGSVTQPSRSDQEITDQLDSFLSRLTTESSFSGSVLVARDNKVLLNKGYGEAD